MSREERKCGYCTLRQRCHSRVMPRDVAKDVGARYIEIMREASGVEPLDGTRKRESVWARNFIAYQMYRDGFTQEDIGSVIGRDRCTVVHCLKSVDDMLDSPEMYPDEMTVWIKFKEKLYLDKNKDNVGKN